MSPPGSPRSRNTPHFMLHYPPIAAPMGDLVSVDVANRLDVGGGTVWGTAFEMAATHMVAPADIKERA